MNDLNDLNDLQKHSQIRSDLIAYIKESESEFGLMIEIVIAFATAAIMFLMFMFSL